MGASVEGVEEQAVRAGVEVGAAMVEERVRVAREKARVVEKAPTAAAEAVVAMDLEGRVAVA